MTGAVAETGAYRAFLTTAQSVAGEIGEAFLRRLVEALRLNFDAAYVAITTTEGTPPDRVRAILAVDNGDTAAEGREWQLEGTPCALVVQGQEVVVPCDLASLYPADTGYEGYVGVPLRDERGAVRGHLVVLSAEAIADPDLALAVVRVFASRTEAELRRIAWEAERQELIGELTELNRRLGGWHERARAENAFKTRLLGVIAHDLRNPLATISAQAELGAALAARPEAGAERLGRAFGKVTAAADRMAAMIEATLARVREDWAALAPQPRRCDVAALTRVAQEAAAAEAARKGIALGCDARGPVWAMADETLLLPAIDNLVGNAVKYTPPGGRVEIGARLDGAEAEIAVADSGQGLTADDLARAFRPFERLSAQPTGGERSTGLGLANVREIVESMGGTVSAESAGRGQGSTFRLRLPAALPRGGPDAPAD